MAIMARLVGRSATCSWRFGDSAGEDISQSPDQFDEFEGDESEATSSSSVNSQVGGDDHGPDEESDLDAEFASLLETELDDESEAIVSSASGGHEVGASASHEIAVNHHVNVDEESSASEDVGGDDHAFRHQADICIGNAVTSTLTVGDSQSEVDGELVGAVEHQDITLDEILQFIAEEPMQTLPDANDNIQFDNILEQCSLDPLIIGDFEQMQLDFGEIGGFEENIGDSSEQLELVDENAAPATSIELILPGWPVVAPSKTQGITQHKTNLTWEAHLRVKEMQLDRTKKVFLGSYSTAVQAKHAHDKAAIKLEVRVRKNGKPYALNFSELMYADYMREYSSWGRRDFIWRIRRDADKFSKGNSGMKGVTVRVNPKDVTQRRQYEAAFTVVPYKGKKRSCFLGKYDCEEQAAREYDKAQLLIKGFYTECPVMTNFRPGSYLAAEVEELARRLLLKYANQRSVRDHLAGCLRSLLAHADESCD